MIFKYLMTNPDGTAHWDYYDGVKSASTEFDHKIERMCVRLCFDRSGNEDIVFPVNEEAYLMNDNGKTIEKFYGPVQLERNLKAVKEMVYEEAPNE